MQHAGPKLRFASTVLGTGPKVHYAEQGHPEGEAIVLVHGWPDSWFSFSRVLAMLPTHYHAVAFDQRGFGNSERPAYCYGIDDLAADLVVFLDAVGIRRASLVGHSLGSFIARRVAETRPERVARLVLISSAVTAANNKVLVAAQASLRTLQNPVAPEFARQFQASTASRPLPEAFLEQLVAESRKLPARLWREVLDGVLAFDDAADLDRITAPTLAIWGEHDARFPPRGAGAPGSRDPRCQAAGVPPDRPLPELGTPRAGRQGPRRLYASGIAAIASRLRDRLRPTLSPEPCGADARPSPARPAPGAISATTCETR
jgi:non-heme chloroperoxidase